MSSDMMQDSFEEILNYRSLNDLPPNVQEVVKQIAPYDPNGGLGERPDPDGFVSIQPAWVVWAPDTSLHSKARAFGEEVSECEISLVQNISDVQWAPHTALIYYGHAVGGASTFAAVLRNPFCVDFDEGDPKNYMSSLEIVEVARRKNVNYLTLYLACCCSLGATNLKAYKLYNTTPALRLRTFGQEIAGDLPAIVALTPGFLFHMLRCVRRRDDERKKIGDFEFNQYCFDGRLSEKDLNELKENLREELETASLGKRTKENCRKRFRQQVLPLYLNSGRKAVASPPEKATPIVDYPASKQVAAQHAKLLNKQNRAFGMVLCDDYPSGKKLWDVEADGDRNGHFEQEVLFSAYVNRRFVSGKNNAWIVATQPIEPCNLQNHWCKWYYLGFAIDLSVRTIVHFNKEFGCGSPDICVFFDPTNRDEPIAFCKRPS